MNAADHALEALTNALVERQLPFDWAVRRGAGEDLDAHVRALLDEASNARVMSDLFYSLGGTSLGTAFKAVEAHGSKSPEIYGHSVGQYWTEVPCCVAVFRASVDLPLLTACLDAWGL